MIYRQSWNAGCLERRSEARTVVPMFTREVFLLGTSPRGDFFEHTFQALPMLGQGVHHARGDLWKCFTMNQSCFDKFYQTIRYGFRTSTDLGLDLIESKRPVHEQQAQDIHRVPSTEQRKHRPDTTTCLARRDVVMEAVPRARAPRLFPAVPFHCFSRLNLVQCFTL